MSRAAVWGAAILAIARVAALGAQAPDFSGTWKLDAGRSTVASDATFAGLIGAGAPPVLHVTHAANGTLIVESQINESHARFYKPGAKTTTPVSVGTLGSITMTSAWEGRTLVGEGSREASAAGTSTAVKEKLSLGADGRTFSIEIAVTGPAGASTSTLTYTRTQDVGPCESWPTPCKK